MERIHAASRSRMPQAAGRRSFCGESRFQPVAKRAQAVANTPEGCVGGDGTAPVVSPELSESAPIGDHGRKPAEYGVMRCIAARLVLMKGRVGKDVGAAESRGEIRLGHGAQTTDAYGTVACQCFTRKPTFEVRAAHPGLRDGKVGLVGTSHLSIQAQ